MIIYTVKGTLETPDIKVLPLKFLSNHSKQPATFQLLFWQLCLGGFLLEILIDFIFIRKATVHRYCGLHSNNQYH